jgi:hypothetical protein
MDKVQKYNSFNTEPRILSDESSGSIKVGVVAAQEIFCCIQLVKYIGIPSVCSLAASLVALCAGELSMRMMRVKIPSET